MFAAGYITRYKSQSSSSLVLANQLLLSVFLYSVAFVEEVYSGSHLLYADFL